MESEEPDPSLEDAPAYSIAGSDFLAIANRVGRNAGLRLYSEYQRKIRQSDHATVLSELWSFADAPERTLGTERSVELWESVGFTVNGIPADPPEEPIRLYRGASPRGRRGMSWTTDRATAQWFTTHRSSNGDRVVYTALVAPRSLLAQIHDPEERGEFEYVIDPYGVRITEAGSQ